MSDPDKDLNTTTDDSGHGDPPPKNPPPTTEGQAVEQSKDESK